MNQVVFRMRSCDIDIGCPDPFWPQKANKDYHSGQIRINKKGLLDVHLHCGDDFTEHFTDDDQMVRNARQGHLDN